MTITTQVGKCMSFVIKPKNKFKIALYQTTTTRITLYFPCV